MTSFPSAPPAQAERRSPRLDEPYYGISFAAAVKRGFQKYGVFSGRASRSEFWWWTLALSIVGVVLETAVEAVTTSSTDDLFTFVDVGGASWAVEVVDWLWLLATLVPGLAITSRRLHDVDRSGWWILFGLIPIVGWVILIVWLAGRSRPAGLRFDRR